MSNNKKPDGRHQAIEQQTTILRWLHRFGWLRTRDLAALIEQPTSKTPPKTGPSLEPPNPSPVSIRRTQRYLAALRKQRMILVSNAPNGSRLYTLSEKGSRVLQSLGVGASTGKDLLRNFHASYFLHRCIANEVIISGLLQGFKVSTEREISQGRWLGGKDGILGKNPDGVMRQGNYLWFIEVERSRRNGKDYAHLLKFLSTVFSDSDQFRLVRIKNDSYIVQQVIFICTEAFQKRLQKDLFSLGWSPEKVSIHIRFEKSLYSFEAIAFY